MNEKHMGVATESIYSLGDRERAMNELLDELEEAPVIFVAPHYAHGAVTNMLSLLRRAFPCGPEATHWNFFLEYSFQDLQQWCDSHGWSCERHGDNALLFERVES